MVLKLLTKCFVKILAPAIEMNQQYLSKLTFVRACKKGNFFVKMGSSERSVEKRYFSFHNQ